MSSDTSEPYKLQNKLAIIINNQEFDKLIELKENSELLLPMENWLNDRYGIVPLEKKNPTKKWTCEEMKEFLKDVADNHTENKDCLICVIVTYGGEGYVYGTKGHKDEDKMTTEDIMAIFNGTSCENLKDKPKLYFIQTFPPKWKEQKDSPGPGDNKDSYTIPVEADQLLVHSCIPEPPAFFAAFGKVFEESSDKPVDILSAVTRMNGKIKHECKPVPITSTTLRRDLVL